MPKRQLHFFVLLAVLTTVYGFFKSFASPQNVYSALSDHIVISEIQIAGNSANDEFVELYNPTSNAVSLEGFRLTRKTASGSESNLVANIAGTIPAHGYFLIAHAGYEGTVSANINYSATSNAIAINNTVILYSDAGVTVVDKVGMGEAIDFEGQATTNPDALKSIERKAKPDSNSVSMSLGGSDKSLGNGEDTENNLNDFIQRDLSEPQNSQSQTEIYQETSVTPTPVNTTPSPTPTSSPSQSKILISEIQIAGSTSTDEFIELYNPTGNSVNLTGWKLAKKTATGTQSNLVTEFPEGMSIKSHGYLLIAHPNYDGVVTADQLYTTSTSLAASNTVILFDNNASISDKVGMGEAIDFETQAFPSPENETSIERKASGSSTADTMKQGGSEEFAGNKYDTDNNGVDFVIRSNPNPQNFDSAIEPNVNISVTPTPVVTTTPSITPSSSPTPTTTPTITITPSVTVTPTSVPTTIPTPTPTITPVPDNQGIVIAYFPLSQTTCRLKFEFRIFRFFIKVIPRITCR